MSPFPPAECGIGNYARELVRALRSSADDVAITIIAERTREPDAEPVLRAWHRKNDWAIELLETLEALRPDVVHVQHEESIFGNRACLPFFRALRERGIRSVVTLHTLHDSWRLSGFHRELARACDVLVVHQRSGMASVLAKHGVPVEQVQVIAHGTPMFDLPPALHARAALDLPADAPIALFFGFIHYGKGTHVAVEAFERARLGDARFVIAGRMRTNNVIDRVYAAWLRRKMARGIAEGRIIFRPGFVPVEHKPLYFAAANVIVLPHDQSYGSASGVLHEAIAARRPILCTRGKKFAEVVEAVGDAAPHSFPQPGDVTAWTRGFESLLFDEVERTRTAALVASLADTTSWAASARQHARIYRALVRDRLSAFELANPSVRPRHADRAYDDHRSRTGALRNREQPQE